MVLTMLMMAGVGVDDGWTVAKVMEEERGLEMEL